MGRIKNLKGKGSKENNIQPETFYEHFKELYSKGELFHDDHEARNCISKLKRNKSAGIDLLIPEIFIVSKVIISPLLCKLFNYMYDNCLYPDSWSRGIIVPVSKKGDMRNVNNYRSITLTSIFSKIFSHILDARLRSYVEDNNYLNASQYGFKENKSTTDCIFRLKSITDSTVNAGKKFFCAFIDFRKAFDLVYRNGIWFKLLSCGVSSKFVNMIRKMYVKVCVRSMHKKVREKSREGHNHKPQPFPDPKRKRKPTNPNKHKPNKRTKSTKISPLFPKRGNRNTKRTEKHKNKMTHGKTYNKSPRRINHKATKSKTSTGTTALERSVEQTTGGFKALLQLTNFTLGPDATLNTEIHKNSVRIKAPNSVNASKRKHKNQINHYNKQRRVLMANSTVCQSK